MKKIYTLAIFTAILLGCAGTSQEQAANKMLEMQQQKNELIEKGVVAGLGVGESSSEQLAYDEADLKARTDVARELESKINGLLRNYEEDVGAELTKHKEAVRKNVVSTLLNGVTIVKIDMETTADGKFKVYAIAAMNAKLIRDAFEQQMQAQQADMNRVKAMSGYKKLDEEAAALDAYKAAQGK